ncbi:uncharacterized protein BT62DRAFT_1079679 [Guyanagaster necrorhizus]|uniref:Uncharacterized protein n=1 Tax=Guyanagaster necrorhizus TaxID=856835 RepID=A0A9P7VK19_9AGAR|nr:uncharacterized protein BT62DRAFT_1079679 [Guyanagaster necrorhizus MCA 3950]KAG7441927.1 hypothetical protein BT62DRAFT_1079679 [Guyanagaster necrorhizus MCA 3950]
MDSFEWVATVVSEKTVEGDELSALEGTVNEASHSSGTISLLSIQYAYIIPTFCLCRHIFRTNTRSIRVYIRIIRIAGIAALCHGE